MKRLLLSTVLVLTLALLGCGGSFEPPSEERTERPRPEPEPVPQKEFAYAPLDHDLDDIVVPEKYAKELAAAKDTGDAYIYAVPEGDSLEFPTGAYESYRIQLFTSKEYGPAFREHLVAKEVFDKPVWLDYEVPYYKVRVGNFFNRSQADRYLPAAREAGYKTAWVVKVNTSVKQMEDIYDTEMVPVIDSLEKEFMEGPEEGFEEMSDTLDYEPEDPQN